MTNAAKAIIFQAMFPHFNKKRLRFLNISLDCTYPFSQEKHYFLPLYIFWGTLILASIVVHHYEIVSGNCELLPCTLIS